jgi:hypothetical protein
MRILIALFMLVSIGSAACAPPVSQARLVELRRELDPKVGVATDQDIARAWGPPDSRLPRGVVEYWTYVRPYTTPATADSPAVTTNDRIVLEFRGGILLDWRINRQR